MEIITEKAKLLNIMENKNLTSQTIIELKIKQVNSHIPGKCGPLRMSKTSPPLQTYNIHYTSRLFKGLTQF